MPPGISFFYFTPYTSRWIRATILSRIASVTGSPKAISFHSSECLSAA